MVAGVPDGFWWGTGASSTQCEGAAPASDWFREEQRGTYPRSGDGNGFATRYAEDFGLYAAHGLAHHRLSIEWARIEPEEGRRNPAAIEHYRAVLTAARDAGVAPWVCLHHFTLPGWFTEIGEGAFCDDRARSYHWARHVAFCAETFGDLVFGWKPINEPFGYVALGYQLGVLPPRARNFDRMLDAYRGILLAQRDAWRELRGGATPVATIHNLSPLFPVDDSIPAGRNTRDIDALMWGVWMQADRDGVLALPGRATEEVADLRECCDLVGFSYYNANAVGRDRRFSPYPRARAWARSGTRRGARASASCSVACTTSCRADRCSSASTEWAPTTTRGGATSCASPLPSPRRPCTTASTCAASSSGPVSTTTSGPTATTCPSVCSTVTARRARVPSSRRRPRLRPSERGRRGRRRPGPSTLSVGAPLRFHDGREQHVRSGT